MDTRFQIEAKAVFEDIGPDVASCIVRVTDPENPWLEIRFRIKQWHDYDPDIAYFRIAEIRISPDDVVEAKPSELLRDGTWWGTLLDEVLEEVAFKSSSFDRAAEKEDENGNFIYLYAWDGGEIQEAQMSSD